MGLLGRVDNAYTWLLRVMMGLSAMLMVAMMLAIIYIVLARGLSIPYPGETFAYIEYSVLYILMLGTPWIVRQRGHVYIEMVTAAVPRRTRAVLSRVITAFSAVVCAILAWYAAEVTLEDYTKGATDVRVGDFPRWQIMVCMPLGFALMAVEFLRFTFAAAPMHTGEAGVHE